MVAEVATRNPSQPKPAMEAGQEKPQKGKKSLARSLSTAFRKPSHAHPSSPISDKINVSPTPHADACPRPICPGTMASSHFLDTETDTRRLKSKAVETGQENNALQVKKRRSLRNLSLRYTKQKSSIAGDIDSKKRTVSAGHPSSSPNVKKNQAGGPRKERSETSLHARSEFPSPSVRGGMPVMATNIKSPPAVPQLSRPATSTDCLPSSGLAVKRPHRGNSSPEYSIPKHSTDLHQLPPSPHRLWQTSKGPLEARSSFRSAVTTISSPTTTTTTNRSSILTKGTSFTDVTWEPDSRPGSKAEEGLTVDEAIDMYAAGFTDDPEEELEELRDSSVSDEERTRSTRIAEAISDDMSSPYAESSLSLERSPPAGRPSTDALSRSNSCSKSNTTFFDPLPSSNSALAESRDQYGFLKTSHHITRPIYDAWSAEYLPTQERRTQKWSAYMREQGLPLHDPVKFPSRSAKMQRYIRKGIPPAWRGAVWFYYAGGDAYLSRHPQLYNNLVHLTDSKLPMNEREAIERDLHRTFPENIRFKPDSPCLQTSETPMLASLRRVLSAFAIHRPKIGYCQSLNFIAALLLLFLSEEKAFWMLHIITMLYLPGTHDVSLEGANIDLWVLMVALKHNLPGVWAKVGAAGLTVDEGKKSKLPPISLCTMSWFMSLFIGTLPIETVLRIWDVLFYEGSRTLFRVAITIFKIGESSIRSMDDSMELFQVVQMLPKGMVDAGNFMECVCQKGQIGSDWVERRRGERRMWFAKEKAKAAGISVYEEAESEEPFSQAAVKRKASVWRRKNLERLVG